MARARFFAALVDERFVVPLAEMSLADTTSASLSLISALRATSKSFFLSVRVSPLISSSSADHFSLS
jgi:phage gp37-like protein